MNDLIYFVYKNKFLVIAGVLIAIAALVFVIATTGTTYNVPNEKPEPLQITFSDPSYNSNEITAAALKDKTDEQDNEPVSNESSNVTEGIKDSDTKNETSIETPKSGNNEAPKGVETNDTSNTKPPAQPKKDVSFDGEINLLNGLGSIIVEVNSNAPKGCIFNISILIDSSDEEINCVAVQEDGFVSVGLDAPGSWEPGFMTAYLDLIPSKENQPQSVIDAYGKNGERMIGRAMGTGDGGNVGVLVSDSVGYPDNATAEQFKAINAKKKIQELIDNSNGDIVSIATLNEDDDWSKVKVVLSTFWHKSNMDSKTNFVFDYQFEIDLIVKKADLVDNDTFVEVYYYDQFNEKLATPVDEEQYIINK